MLTKPSKIIMRHLRLLAAVALLAPDMGAAIARGEPKDCTWIKPRSTGSAAIGQPGHYCLKKDLYVGSHYIPFAHGADVKGDDDSLLVLGADNIVVDLKGHRIIGHTPLSGGIETPVAGDPDYKYLCELTDLDRGAWAKNLTVRNGALLLTERSVRANGIRLACERCSFNIAADLVDVWKERGSNDSELRELARSAEVELIEKLPKAPEDYVARNIVIDRMKIRTINVGVRVQGANTVIRNSTIEVDAGTAISIYGPGALIENNTIIVHGDYELKGADAPIRLHHGDNAVIRNNRIVIKGKTPKRVVSTFYTGEFLTRDNVIRGMTDNDPIAKSFAGDLKVEAIGNRFR